MNLPIRTARLVLRNWRDADRALFHEINSDPQVMRYFPFRRNRAESDTLMDALARSIESEGYGFLALADGATDECLGFAGLARTDLRPAHAEPMIEIGWRLARRHWGNGYATEAATALLAHGFSVRSFPEIVAYAVAANYRSTAVMDRIGMRRDAGRDFDHPRVPETHPHLRRHVFYAARRDEWPPPPNP